MTYTTAKELSATKKDFLAVIEPAIIVDTWTLDAGTVYYHDFEVSDTITEYVTQLTKDGTQLVSVTSTPSSGQFYWDFNNKRLYINVGGDPASYTMVVYFEIYMATSIHNTYRDPLDDTTSVVYFEPRIDSATIPQAAQSDLSVFGTAQGSMTLINNDGVFYIYDNASFKNKSIKIYHVLDTIDNIVLIFRGRIETISEMSDEKFTLSYRSNDFLFNEQIRAYADVEDSFYNDTDFPNLDPNYEGYSVRIVYGKVDDILGINVDYSDSPTTSNNRIWAIRSDATDDNQLTYTVATSPASTTTRVYIEESTFYLQIDDSIDINGNGTFVTAIGANYVDVSPALPGAPSNPNQIQRSSVGYVKINDGDGNIYNLRYLRDYTETTLANDVLGITLANNFEANFGPIATFDPGAHKLYCRCYGKTHSTTNDSDYGNLTAAHLVYEDLLENYIGFTASEIDSTQIASVSTQAVGMALPKDLGSSQPTYREIIKKINDSVIGTPYFTNEQKFGYRVIAPLGSSIYTLDDVKILSISLNYDDSNLYNSFKIKYARKEDANGSGQASFRRTIVVSDMATYLHGVSSEGEIETYLLKSSEVDTVANRYKIMWEDFQRIYTCEIKTQLNESILGDVITIEREKLPGYNYTEGTKRTKDVSIVTQKKSLTGANIETNDQKNIEDNSGSW